MFSSKISTLILLLDEQRLILLPSWFEFFKEPEINSFLGTSLQGKPPAIHSQSLVSDVSEGLNIDSSKARFPEGVVVFLDRGGCLRVDLEEGLDTRIHVMFSEDSSSIWFRVLGCGFRGLV